MERRAREDEEEALSGGKGEEENRHPPSSFSPSSSYSDGCDWDCDGYCREESPSPLLDDNGFPDSQLSPGLEDGDGSDHKHAIINNYGGSNGDISQSIQSEESKEDSFASDFYRCGTDWSLLSENKESDKQMYLQQQPQRQQERERPLKQTNLFQMWGFHNTTHRGIGPNPNICSDVSTNKKRKKATASAGPSSSSLVDSNSRGNNNSAFHGGHTGEKSKAALVTGYGAASNQKPRACPFYKKIPGTPFTVDAFRYGRVEGCKAYILSHFHADHYGGLSKGWSHGPIYCTPLTARLVRMCLYVDLQFIHQLELDMEYVIEGIKVTMLEANHCPGAALIHFRLPNGECFLHTGDFRANKSMHAYPLLANQRVSVLYLDTTYCNTKYRFPSKEDVLSFVVGVTQNSLRKQPKTLVIVGAYSIGKECVFLAISKAIGVKIYADSRRRRILKSFGWPELSANLCLHGLETPLHVLPISSLKVEVLERYLKTYVNQFTAVLAFRPTGWTYSEAIGSYLDGIKPTSRGNVTIYGVPYSEHSSFTELREFVQFIKPDKIIPTVNVGNPSTRDKMQSYFREWLKG